MNSSSVLDILTSLVFIELGMFFSIDGGWFDARLTYLVLLLGFLYGLYVPFLVDKVISRKLTVHPFCSMLILRWFLLKILCKPFSNLFNKGPLVFST